MLPRARHLSNLDDSDGGSGDEAYQRPDDNEDDDDDEDDEDARNTKRPSSRGSRAPAKPRASSKAAKAAPKKSLPARTAPTPAGRGKQKSHANNDDEIEDDEDAGEQWDMPQKSSKQVDEDKACSVISKGSLRCMAHFNTHYAQFFFYALQLVCLSFTSFSFFSFIYNYLLCLVGYPA